MPKLRAINNVIFVEKIKDDPSVISSIIEVIEYDKKTYHRGRVLSVGPDVDGVYEGDMVIYPELATFIHHYDDNKKLVKVYCVTEPQLYCRIKQDSE